MMVFIFFLAFFVVMLQAIIGRCIILGVLAGILLISSLNKCLAEYLDWRGHLLTTTVCVVILGAFAYWAFRMDRVYLGHISEYHYAYIEAIVALALNLLTLLPDGKKKTAAVAVVNSE